MGSLAFQPGNSIYLDSQILIYSTEHHTNYFPILDPLWRAEQKGEISLFSSQLIILETLVGPLKQNNQPLVAHYEEFFDSGIVQLLPITPDILKQAAEVRATIPAIAAPDAIHVSTFRSTSCDYFLTNDIVFRKIQGFPLLMLDDFVD